MKYVIHRDQIHNDVYYDPLSIALINSPQMQRLGKVYQLGYAHLVYRGGTHTRLSHVMGVAEVANILVESLKENYQIALEENTLPVGAITDRDFLPIPEGVNKDDVNINSRWEVLKYMVRWGALLHDIGHVPLGHTLEDEYSGIYIKHDSFESPRMPFLWNEVSIGKASRIKEILTDKSLYPKCFGELKMKPEQVWQTVMLICLYKNTDGKEGSTKTAEQDTPFYKLYKGALKLEGNCFHQYMADIVADTICADYLDYLRRDTQNVGLDTVSDFRIIRSYFIGKDISTKKFRMALSLKDKGGKDRLSICTAAKNIVRHRFDLAEIIYYHKTKVAASAMLATVFRLIDKPDDVGTARLRIGIEEIDDYVTNIFVNKKMNIKDLRDKYMPDGLLDTFIGDESLHLWMLERAWEKAARAQKNNNEDDLKRALLAISLLEGITERRLYKVALTINKDFVGKCAGTLESNAIEIKIKDILKKYRLDANASENIGNIEAAMANEASLPYGSFLIYIPGRKAQAKGIETGAFEENGEVNTLEHHSSVIEDVERLNRDYRNLWKIIVYVHPKYKANVVELSKAVDIFLKNLFEKIDCRTLSNDIKKACWFPYIPEKYRGAANQYIRLNKDGINGANWNNFNLAKQTSSQTFTPDEHAYRTKLLDYDISFESVKAKYEIPGSLNEEINKEIVLDGYSFTGKEKEDAVLRILEKIREILINGEPKDSSDKADLEENNDIKGKLF